MSHKQIEKRIAELIEVAESADDFAEICRLEAILNSNQWYQPTTDQLLNQ